MQVLFAPLSRGLHPCSVLMGHASWMFMSSHAYLQNICMEKQGWHPVDRPFPPAIVADWIRHHYKQIEPYHLL